MFRVLGVLVLIYAVFATFKGEVYAKSGPWGRMVSRGTSPHDFWVVIGIYGCLGIALITIF